MVLTFSCKKLVRDNSIKRMEKNGAIAHYKVLDKNDFISALQDKLIEETAEVKESNTKSELVDELTDVLEVIDALTEAYGITQEEIIATKQKRLQERGGFKQRIFLDKVEVDPDNKLVAYFRAAPNKYKEL